MPYPRPTLTQLIAQAASDITSNLPGADGLLRFSNLGILGRVIAALVNGIYGFIDWVAQQATPFTATDEYLEGWAAFKSVTREPAVAAQLQVQFSGLNGYPLPAGTPVVRGDGRGYTVNATQNVVGTTVTVTVTDSVPGAAGSSANGTVMTLGSAVAGIQSGGVVTGPGVAGVDVETDEALRTRMLQGYAAPPQGGDLADYVTWALQVPGVTRAWNAGVALGAGKVQIFFMMDVAEVAFGGFPQGTNGVATNETRDVAATGDQLTVANWIYPLRPVTALVYLYAPAANAVAMTINGIAGASAPTKAAIAAAFAAVIAAEASPGGVTDAQGNLLPPVELGDIEAAIDALPETRGFVITAVSCPHGTITPAGVGDIASNAGYLATPGLITYT